MAQVAIDRQGGSVPVAIGVAPTRRAARPMWWGWWSGGSIAQGDMGPGQDRRRQAENSLGIDRISTSRRGTDGEPNFLFQGERWPVRAPFSNQDRAADGSDPPAPKISIGEATDHRCPAGDRHTVAHLSLDPFKENLNFDSVTGFAFREPYPFEESVEQPDRRKVPLPHLLKHPRHVPRAYADTPTSGFKFDLDFFKQLPEAFIADRGRVAQSGHASFGFDLDLPFLKLSHGHTNDMACKPPDHSS
jgi:hypothetical protein